MQGMTFRSSKIIYYGPHECSGCGQKICKMGHEFGGNAFTYPEGPIYPNTEWHVHVCDPKTSYRHKGLKAKERVLQKYPNAAVECVGNGSAPDSTVYRVVVSPESTGEGRFLGTAFGTTHEAAWHIARDFAFPGEGEQL